jgi:putative tricarboxylic transport membrane protein
MASEKVGALLMLLFSTAYGWLATRIPLSFLAQRESFTSRTMPYGLAVLGIVLAVLILVLPTVDEKGKPAMKEVVAGLDWRRAFSLVGLMIVYGLIMKWTGFVIASILFLLAGFYLLGERRWKVMLLAAVPLVLVLWFVMSSLLGMYIAPGEIFYQLGIL